MLFDFQSAYEQIVLLYICRNGGQLQRVLQKLPVYFHVSGNFKIALVFTRQYIQQGCLTFNRIRIVYFMLKKIILIIEKQSEFYIHRLHLPLYDNLKINSIVSLRYEMLSLLASFLLIYPSSPEFRLAQLFRILLFIYFKR